MTLAGAVNLAAAEISLWFDTVFGELNVLSSRISSTLITTKGTRPRFVESDLKPVKFITSDFLARQDFVEAAGIILAPGTIGGNRGTIEWWRRDEAGKNTRVIFNLAPETGLFYDFENLSWFNTAVQTGTRAITGPYVDYGGLDQYIMTLTVPLELGANVIGMVGCDIEVRDIEAVIVPLMRRIPGDAALINADQRVILGNSGRFLVGNRVRQTPAHGTIVPVSAHALGLSVVYAEHANYD